MSQSFIISTVDSYNRNSDRAEACGKIVRFVQASKSLRSCRDVWAYVSGANGGRGWMDDCQNALIVNLLSTDTLFREAIAEKPPGQEFSHHESTFEDLRDHSLWSFQRDEWRMGAERLFLRLCSPQSEWPTKIAVIPPDWTATPGYEPEGKKLSYNDWVEYLIGS